ncbi:MAG: hypothetical protein ISS57_00640 [Anaerolineales bacterium]|nr:hypothetical protein [Anaerolineales bacterium]
MNKDTNVENGGQAIAAQSQKSADSLLHHDIRDYADPEYQIPSPLIAWLARINQRYLSENMREDLIE